MRPKAWVLSGTGLLVGVALAAMLPSEGRRPPRPTLAHFDGVGRGMSGDEVTAAVGFPPGDYKTSTDVAYASFGSRVVSHGAARQPERVRDEWACDDGLLRVEYGDRGQAVSIEVMPNIRPPRPSVMVRLCQWLGL